MITRYFRVFIWYYRFCSFVKEDIGTRAVVFERNSRFYSYFSSIESYLYYSALYSHELFSWRETLSSDKLKLNSIILPRSNWTRSPRSSFSLHLFYFYRVTRPYNGPSPLELAFKCRVLIAVLFKKTRFATRVQARFQQTHSRVAK